MLHLKMIAAFSYLKISDVSIVVCQPVDEPDTNSGKRTNLGEI